MATALELYPRPAQRSVQAALADIRVVVLNGARQTGKGTLARMVLGERPGAQMRGPEPLSFGDRLRALPISALWTARQAQPA